MSHSNTTNPTFVWYQSDEKEMFEKASANLFALEQMMSASVNEAERKNIYCLRCELNGIAHRIRLKIEEEAKKEMEASDFLDRQGK